VGLVVGLAVLGLLVGLAVLVGVAVRNKVRNTVVSFLVMGAYMAGLTWTSMSLGACIAVPSRKVCRVRAVTCTPPPHPPAAFAPKMMVSWTLLNI
jgi:hypothetical protein